MTDKLSTLEKTGLSRRQLLGSLVASSLLSPLNAFAKENDSKLLISAARDRHGQHWVICLQGNGKPVSRLKLPARAHQVIKHPHKEEIAVIGRRPGQYIIVSSIKSGRVIKHIQPEQGFHFYGHALYTPDGRYLVSTENHIDSGQGRLFVRDVLNDYRVHAQLSSHGIGPHEIKLCSDTDTLVIANGGILTHPDKGRVKLNLDTMSPSLTYVSLTSGDLLEQVKLKEEYHQLSIRHIDINQRDEVVIGLQYQGDKTDSVPLVAHHQRGKDLKPLWAPDDVNYAMKHYCGSVCFDPIGKTAAVSSPKGDLITFWDFDQLIYLSSLRCKDGCGLTSYRNNEFVISNGLGNLYHYNNTTKELSQNLSNPGLKIAWDNHLLSA